MKLTRYGIKPKEGKKFIGRDWTPEDFLKAFKEIGYKHAGFFWVFLPFCGESDQLKFDENNPIHKYIRDYPNSQSQK